MHRLIHCSLAIQRAEIQNCLVSKSKLDAASEQRLAGLKKSLMAIGMIFSTTKDGWLSLDQTLRVRDHAHFRDRGLAANKQPVCTR